jgi:hydroxyacylglutathione hydrolase
MSTVQTVAEDKRMRLVRLELGPFGTNAYIVVCRETGESILVDAPGEAEVILEQLNGTKPRCILITHSHADHTLALEVLKETLGIPVGAHAADRDGLPVQPDLLLRDGDTVECGRLTLETLHTPGHTPGSLCYKAGHCLLSGDTIFPGGPGKTASPADLQQIICSITEKIFPLPGDTPLYPGHGGFTLVGKEQEQYAQFASRPPDPDLYGDVTWLEP